ncbi:hypothetical protein KAX75_11105 [candidate division WOR-3 bacterium]|nr:hypothetical protein [candidate division WOR-3 bacterium]
MSLCNNFNLSASWFNTIFFLIDPWDKIILDIILLFITLGILHRMILMTRKAEKEKLADVIKELSKEIKVLKGEKEEDNSK